MHAAKSLRVWPPQVSHAGSQQPKLYNSLPIPAIRMFWRSSGFSVLTALFQQCRSIGHLQMGRDLTEAR
jgi:hypothetical protein